MANTNKEWVKQKIKFFCKKIEKGILADKSLKCRVVFGPIRSRRLGYVLGINNVKSKICSYDCIYCPSGNTTCYSVCANYCLSPYELHLSVKNKLEELKKSNKKIEYIVFAGGGEATLDSSLSKEISLLREFGYKIAVFTNASLLWNYDIQENLMYADYVSVKIDTVNDDTWMKINRPHRKLDYNVILNGIKEFSQKFNGTFVTETTLIKNLNDNAEEIENLSTYLNSLKHEASYFMTPIYPPSESYAESPDKEILDHLSKMINEKVNKSVMLCCPKTEEFFATGDFENELLGLLSLHPVGVEAVNHFIKDKVEIEKLKDMIKNNVIKEINFNGKKYLAGKEDINLNMLNYTHS
ncbi:MAG: radical SAM protein [Bacteroidetes bacterium]|nr:radical SAM protein [Bacteroidota bacterium]